MTKSGFAPSSKEWGELENVKNVSSELSNGDVEFFRAVGRVLCEANQTGRFAVTLLHSHFSVANEEFLGETVEENGELVQTRVYRQVDVNRKFPNLVPRSWRIEKGKLISLTYINSDQLGQEPISNADTGFISKLIDVYEDFKMSNRFGLAHPGPMLDREHAWVESEWATERRLTQSIVSSNALNDVNVLSTMWIFDIDGRQIVTLGCCYRDKNGHQWRHASGRNKD